MRIDVDHRPDPAFRKALLDQLDAHNAAGTGLRDNGVSLSALVRRPDGSVEGGAIGYVWYGWLLIELFYLPASLRGHGMGTQIIRALEQVAATHGAHSAWVSSYSFQAPGFYERQGYCRFGAVADRPIGHADVFLARTDLAATPARQAPSISVEGRADAETRVVLAEGLLAHSDAIVGANRPRALAVILSGADGRPLGGLWAVAMRDWLFLDLFTLPANCRRGGHGARILAAAEAEARAMGCIGVWLDTFSFQARPFYESQGYTLFGQLDDYPTGHARYFLSKRLDT